MTETENIDNYDDDNSESLDMIGSFKNENLKIPNFDQLLCDEIDHNNYMDFDS